MTNLTLVEPLAEPDVLTLFDDLRSAEIVTDTGLDLDALRKRGLSYEEWESLGVYLGKAVDALRWAIGDWLIFGEQTFAEKYAQGVEATGRSIQTLKNWAWVAGSYAKSRRRDKLSWSHHEAVASLPPAGQNKYLNRAEKEGWTVDETRSARRSDEIAARAAERGEDAETIERLTVREAAHRVWISSTRDGPDYRVPVESMLALARAIGEPL